MFGLDGWLLLGLKLVDGVWLFVTWVVFAVICGLVAIRLLVVAN